MFIDKKELKILSEFRKNARENLTTASRKLKVPVSTIYDRLRRYNGNLIQKHTAILDFEKLGFHVKVFMAMKSDKNTREGILEFLEGHYRVNNISRVSNNRDFFIEAIFKDLKELEDFKENLEKIGIKEKDEYYVVKDILREAFLTTPESIDMIADK